MLARWIDVLTLGPRRRRSRLDRQLADLADIDSIEFLGQRAGAGRPRSDRRRGDRRRNARPRVTRDVLIAVVALTIAGWWTLSSQLGWEIGFDGVRGPRVLGAPPATSGSGGYVFSATQPGDAQQPVTYSPCAVIRVVVNDDLAPPGTQGLLEEALDEVSGLTGLQFRVDGRTDEQPDRRPRGQDAPVLIAWTTPEQVPELAGDVAGLGGSTSLSRRPGGLERYVSGQVGLDAPQLADILDRRDGRAHVRAIVLHELGHVVGLGHTPDPDQLMHEQNRGVLEFAAGDRRGLAALGRGSCAPLV